MPDVLQQLKRMVAADSEPKISDDEAADLLAMFPKPDGDGNLPTDPAWEPTYNLRAAAAEGWRWKAGKASELQSTDLDGDRMSANQIFDHCQEMIKVYSRGTTSVTLTNLTSSLS